MYSLINYYLFGKTTDNNDNDYYSEESKTDDMSYQPKVLPLLKDPTNFYYLSLINENDNTWSIHGLRPQ